MCVHLLRAWLLLNMPITTASSISTAKGYLILAVAWDILGELMVAKTNGKYGFLNTTFEWVIAPIYNEVWDCDHAFLRTAMYPLETR
jgi:hypothetical protein